MMKVTRTRNGKGTSIWAVEINQAMQEKIANANNGDTISLDSKFEVSMRVQDGSNGYIKNLGNDKAINYAVKYDKPSDDRVIVNFNLDSGETFSFPFASSFRSYGTGAFYRFFNQIIRNTALLSSVNIGVTKKETKIEEEKADENPTESVLDTTEKPEVAEVETPEPEDPEPVTEDLPEKKPVETKKSKSKSSKKTAKKDNSGETAETPKDETLVEADTKKADKDEDINVDELMKEIDDAE